jgi:hypothetical protein
MVVPPADSNLAGRPVSTGLVTGLVVAGIVDEGTVAWDAVPVPAIVWAPTRAAAGFLTSSVIMTAAAIASKPINTEYISHGVAAGVLLLAPLVLIAAVAGAAVAGVVVVGAVLVPLTELPVPYVL